MLHLLRLKKNRSVITVHPEAPARALLFSVASVTPPCSSFVVSAFFVRFLFCPLTFSLSLVPRRFSFRVFPADAANAIAMEKGKTRKMNRFHQIREREFNRERVMLMQQTNDVQPSHFTPSLTEICAQQIAKDFKRVELNQINTLDETLRKLIVEMLPTDLDLTKAVQINWGFKEVEDYWRHRCEATWSAGLLTGFTDSKKLEPPAEGGWKRLFLERHLEEHLMSMEVPTKLPDGGGLLTLEERDAKKKIGEDELTALCVELKTYVLKLHLAKQRTHIDLVNLFSSLPQLRDFRVSYGVLNAGVEFVPDMVGMLRGDAEQLKEILRNPRFGPNLSRLSLAENAIDDDLCRMIIGGLVGNTGMRALDFSHNRIGDLGAQAVGTVLLQPQLKLVELDLGDNEIREDGVAALGDALAVNKTLQSLSLRLNRVGDAGGESLFDGLRTNGTLTALDLSNNEIGTRAARGLVLALQENRTLSSLNLYCNALFAEGGEQVLQAAEASPALIALDVRGSHVAEADEEAIARLMHKRVTARQKDRVAAEEARMKAAIDREVADKVQRTHGVSDR